MNHVVGPVKLTEKEYVAESFAIVKEMYGRKMKWNLAISIAVMGFGGLMRAYGSSGTDKTFGVSYLILGVSLLAFVVIWPFATRAQYAKIARNPLNRSFFMETTFEFREDGFENKSSSGTVSYTPWNCVVQAKRTANALILYTSQLGFCVIPLRQIEDELLVFISEKLKSNGTGI